MDNEGSKISVPGHPEHPNSVDKAPSLSVSISTLPAFQPNPGHPGLLLPGGKALFRNRSLDSDRNFNLGLFGQPTAPPGLNYRAPTFQPRTIDRQFASADYPSQLGIHRRSNTSCAPIPRRVPPEDVTPGGRSGRSNPGGKSLPQFVPDANTAPGQPTRYDDASDNNTAAHASNNNTSLSFPNPTPGPSNGSPGSSHQSTSSDSPTFPIPALPRPVNFILQWNINGFYNNLANLELLIHGSPPWCIALQEVNKVSKQQLDRSLGGKYSWVIKKGSNFRHSVGIGVLNSIPYEPLHIDTNLPITGVRLLGTVNVNIVNVYLPCAPIADFRARMVKALQAISGPVIFVGDTNAHHPAWGGNRADSRGVTLCDLFEEADMVIMNDGSNTFYNGHSSSAIDVSAASRPMLPKLQWSLNSDTYGSDHHPIQIAISATAPEFSIRPRWKYEQADWEAYNLSVRQLLRDHEPHSLTGFTEMLQNAASSSIPKTGNKPGRRALRWWTEDTRKAVKARRKALRAVKRLPANHPDKETALKRYRELHVECRSKIREAKQSSWENFLESMDSSQSSADLWSKVNALSGKRKSSPLTIASSNTTTSNPTEVAEILGEYFSGLSAIRSYSDPFLRRLRPSLTSVCNFPIPADGNEDFINSPFTIDELQYALKCSTGKSAGPDGIGYPLLKNLPPSGIAKLLELVNAAWVSNTYPEEWRESLVIPIPKPNTSTREPAKYRPIALTCCLGKVVERMVNRRLRQRLQNEGRLDHRQHAFRPGYGTSTYFASLGDILQSAKAEALHTEIVSLDISKAFNRTWTPFVLQQLVDWGLSGHIVHFIKNFLTNRSFRVSVGDTTSQPFPEETGVPQGSVIAVTLFLIAMNSVFSILPQGVYILVYADDILLVITGRTAGRTRIRAQAAVSAVVKWTESVGFTLSANKSVRCHVCSSRHRTDRHHIKINGSPIPNKKVVKVLGVTIDRTLSFKPHFKNIKENCRTRLNLLKTISKPHRSNNRRIRFRVAEAIVDSRLLYGLELTCTASRLLIQTLGPCYNNSIRIVSGLLPSTPADSACVEAGRLPFRYLVHSAVCTRAASYCEKTSGHDKVPLLTEGDRIFRSVAGSDLPQVAKIHWYGDRSWQSPSINIDTEIQRRFRAGDNTVQLRTAVLEWLNRKYSTHLKRYTDGSKTHLGVGVGVYSGSTSTSLSLQSWCSVFSAETAALFIAATTPSDQPVIVLTDSASAIAALQAESPSHPWVQAIIKYLPDNVTFAWIPGHCGIPGNEAADSLAGAGRTGPKFKKATPRSDLKEHIQTTIKNHWQSEWLATRFLITRKVKEVTKAWDDLPSLRDQRVVSRLRTGHTRLSHNMGEGLFKTMCPVCHTRNSVEHILCSCPQYEFPRQTYKLSGNINQVLSNDAAGIAALIVFLKDAGIYYQI